MTQDFLYNVIAFVEVALTVLIIARIAVSWIGLSPWHPIVRWLRVIVDPILAPFRRILPSFSGIDFSPILALVVEAHTPATRPPPGRWLRDTHRPPPADRQPDAVQSGGSTRPHRRMTDEGMIMRE